MGLYSILKKGLATRVSRVSSSGSRVMRVSADWPAAMAAMALLPLYQRFHLFQGHPERN